MKSTGDTARTVIEQLWYRARINAFAHRTAAEEASGKATTYFKRELIAALGAILFVILVYVFSTSHEAKALKFGELTAASLAIIFTLASIICTLVSLYQSVMANYLKFDVRAARHEHCQNSFQFLAQRAREVKWPDLPAEKVEELLVDLERDFALLKATSTEPADRHFDEAHRLVRKIRGDSEVRIAQSFEVGAIEEAAQHIGDPENIQRAAN